MVAVKGGILTVTGSQMWTKCGGRPGPSRLGCPGVLCAILFFSDPCINEICKKLPARFSTDEMDSLHSVGNGAFNSLLAPTSSRVYCLTWIPSPASKLGLRFRLARFRPIIPISVNDDEYSLPSPQHPVFFITIQILSLGPFKPPAVDSYASAENELLDTGPQYPFLSMNTHFLHLHILFSLHRSRCCPFKPRLSYVSAKNELPTNTAEFVVEMAWKWRCRNVIPALKNANASPPS
ncbi:hypothetical protein C8R45DRAFT_1069255 [Mycena sanguinolenta]|nr:hypothetical protein C8R45DRAFT_1069255 [Mycena sanguinolenta]